MRRTALATALLLMATPAFAGHVVRTLNETIQAEGLERLALDIPVAEVTVEGGTIDAVEVEVELDCRRTSRRCAEKAEGIRLDTSTVRGTLRMSLEGYAKTGGPGVKMIVRMPHDRDLSIDLGVGELEIEGVEADLALDVGVGEVEVHMDERHVAEVHLDVGVGEADFAGPDRGISKSGFLFLGNELDWDEGSGDARVSVDVGVGEIDVELH